MPWNELLSNLAIVALAASIWTAVYGAVIRYPVLWQRLAMGGLLAVATLVAMMLPFQFVPGVFLDLRYTLIAIAGFFGGPAAAAIPVAVAVIRRLMVGGTGIWVAIPNIMLAFAAGCAGHYLVKQHHVSVRSIALLAVAVVFSGTIGFFVVVPIEKWPSMVTSVVAPFGVMLFVATFFSALAIAQEQRRLATLKENWTYRAVTDALPDCLSAKDLQGRFIAANPATARLMAADDVSSLIGKSDADFYDEKTAATFRQQETNIVAGGTAEAFEEEVLRPDGESVWLSSLKAPLNDGEGRIVGIITHNRDITDQKRLELELVEAQRHLTDALSNMADGLALFNAKGELVFSNRLYLEMFPLTAEVRIPGASLARIIEFSLQRGETMPPEGQDCEVIEDIVEQLTVATGTREIRMTDGRWLQARMRATSNGGSMIMFTDITRAKDDERSLKDLNTKLFAMANSDGLTGLMNRRAFDLALREAIELFNETKIDVGLLMIDVDKFKVFNDTHGHPAGDDCLRQVSGCLKQVVSAFSGATVGRYGGEEFGIILPRLDVSECESVGRLIVAAVGALGLGDPHDPLSSVTVSVGVAAMKCGSVDGGELLRRADAALYEAKDAGRDCVRVSRGEVVPVGGRPSLFLS